MPGQSSKEIRYDRQLRLWGDNGQQRLENANICLLHASALGTEILKSLVLPGIGAFEIFDSELIDDRDSGNNFFLPSESTGKPKAQVACQMIMELNPRVKGRFKLENPDQMVDEKLSLLDEFTVVVGTNLMEKTALIIGKYLWKRDIAFVNARCYGLIGYLRICLQEHTIIESHPDNPKSDLRLDSPFPELVELARNTNLNTMTHEQHSHTPYLLLLMKGLEKWRLVRNDPSAFPDCYEQRIQFKSLLFSMRRPDEKNRIDEENFREAADALTQTMQRTKVPQLVEHLFSCSKCLHPSPYSSFWLLVSCLSDFVSNTGSLPLSGRLPDMTSDSVSYANLTTVFRNRALSDAGKVFDSMKNKAEVIGSPLESVISMDDVVHFCKNASDLRLIEGSGIDDEFNKPVESVITALSQMDSCPPPPPSPPPCIWYILLRAADRFRAEKGRFPGTNGVPCILDAHDLRLRIRTLLSDWKCVHLDDKVDDGAVQELCRYGAGEPHVVAALIGGITAQQVIKIVTRQYVPLDNAFLYDGHVGAGQSFRI